MRKELLQVKQARQAAMDILKPSQKDLEHGLELHKNSIVCDTYAFAPNAPFASTKLHELAAAGASLLEFNDSKEEMTMLGHLSNSNLRKEFIELWKASGVTCIFQNAGREIESPQHLIKRLSYFTYLTDMMPNFLKRATAPKDILEAKKADKACMYYSGNAVPLAGRRESLREELSFIKIFFYLGMRMMHLTYNRRNIIGDGCAESADAGLSDFGRIVIKEMNKVGMICDVAHCGNKTSLEAACLSDKPVVASHTGVLAVNKHIRCKPDDVIKAVADTGGYIGICSIPGFLGQNGDINAMLHHIDYIAENFGTDYVAIGTDIAATVSGYEEELKKVEISSLNNCKTWASFWPPGSSGLSLKYPKKNRQSLSWLNWPLFTVGLVQHGYSDSDIQKIIGGNMLRVTDAVLPKNMSIK